MSIHIGDFWQSKQSKDVIYHVDNYAFKMGDALVNSIMVICTKIYISHTKNEESFIEELFPVYANEDDFKQECELILSAERITKDKKFKSDKDIFDYLAKKVGEQNGK